MKRWEELSDDARTGIEKHIKERLSDAYLRAVVARAGVSLSKPNNDYGIDGQFSHLSLDGDQIRNSGLHIDYQLKATTKWARDRGCIVYDLDVKNYNDFALRAR